MRKRSSSSVRVFFPKFSVDEVVERIKETASHFSEDLGLEKVVLFGSYAKNRHTVSSDIDILVIFDESISDEVYKTPMKNVKLPRVELHILSKKEYESMKGSKWIETMEKEGKRIL